MSVGNRCKDSKVHKHQGIFASYFPVAFNLARALDKAISAR